MLLAHTAIPVAGGISSTPGVKEVLSTLFQIKMEVERGLLQTYKTTILHTEPSMSFHVNLAEGSMAEHGHFDLGLLDDPQARIHRTPESPRTVGWSEIIEAFLRSECRAPRELLDVGRAPGLVDGACVIRIRDLIDF